ncbi:hypothetical protein [Halorussus sp. MSC15.2]|uniref:DUF7847 domain-containing protein n=1 Tax=Halorussus sp. MSC15.2 TaxID=2283638 RepID=UPI0013D65F75|nr:hypothetical protein [Halorussus sp. MSC15.2]NEU55705.1 hypothetical protein [Halorussus sp. MSC15.2]
MVVLDTLGDAVSLLRRRPTLFGYLVALGLVGNLLGSGHHFGLSEFGQKLLARASIVVGPAVTVGVLDLVNRAVVHDRVSFDVVVNAGVRNYLRVVGVSLLLAFGGGIAVILLLVVLPAQLALVVCLVAIAAAALVFQFADLAIVLEGETPRDAMRRSYDVATSNFGPVLGYTVLEVPFGLLHGATFVERSELEGILVTVTPDSTPLTFGILAVGTVGWAVLQTYRVVFYRALVASDGDGQTGRDSAGGHDVTAARTDGESVP